VRIADLDRSGGIAGDTTLGAPRAFPRQP